MALIEFDRVSKIFAHSGGAKLLRSHLLDRFKRQKRDIFYALQDVSFRLDQGESMAVIGKKKVVERIRSAIAILEKMG